MVKWITNEDLDILLRYKYISKRAHKQIVDTRETIKMTFVALISTVSIVAYHLIVG